MKRFILSLSLVLIIIATASVSAAAAPLPMTTFTLVQGLPATMNVGDTATVIVQVESDQQFISALALPSFMFPGKGVIAVQGGDHAGRGTSATLEVTFQAKSSTAGFPSEPPGVAPVHVVVGVRYSGGYVASQDFLFNVTVP
jgi:hypothetical protein